MANLCFILELSLQVPSRCHTPWDFVPLKMGVGRELGSGKGGILPEVKSKCHTPLGFVPDKDWVGRGPRRGRGEVILPEVKKTNIQLC